jgi:hypothetical protein
MQLHRRKHISFLSASGLMIALVLATVCTFVKGASQVQAAAVTITPAGAFTDNNGNYVQAHGGGITRVGSTTKIAACCSTFRVPQRPLVLK